MTLRDLIAFLEKRDPNRAVPIGFGDPHSYRGDYQDLAFRPDRDTTVGAMLEAARSALGATYEGYKGGDFRMAEYTTVWLAEYGHCGEGISPVLLSYMTGEVGADTVGGEVNADLISAAPDLLAAASAMCDAWAAYMVDDGSVNPHDYITGEHVEALLAAVAKATAPAGEGSGS